MIGVCVCVCCRIEWMIGVCTIEVDDRVAVCVCVCVCCRSEWMIGVCV